MKRKAKWILPAAVAVFALLQCFNPSRVNPPVTADFIAAMNPPASVAASLRAACYDCHSDETRWPWYARIAPLSWMIASDVNEGRQHLNLSDWPADSLRAAKKLERINEEVDYREMPLKKYTLIHADARLTEIQRKEILDWTDSVAAKLRNETNSDAAH
jgi:hypothetical protein